MLLLGVNIDHVATLRQARYRGQAGPLPGEPDPLRAAHEAELGGADIITVHLREDRRHIQDRDLKALAASCPLRLNLEMGATAEMVGIALDLRRAGPAPQMATLVPEGRQEVTTEGGLDVAGHGPALREMVARLKAAPGGMTVSAFIDADERQVEAARAAGFDACELHTGPYAAAFASAGGDWSLGSLRREHQRLLDAGQRVRSLGMRLHAGHALNYANVGAVGAMPGMAELHIGHAIVSRAVFTGLREAVATMKRAMAGG
ncbi:MAG: pyridoxine 5'-phosphate synthase [Phycisphaeraceae bacterium]|nr:pyridoxine 5'-phosphate synthase [Phycisphaeraceae bacterium]